MGHLGADPFLAPGAYFEKLGSGPLGDATYQISRLLSFWFQTRRFYHVFPYISLRKTCDPPGRAHF